MDSQPNADFPSQFYVFFYRKNHVGPIVLVLKDRFLKKMLLKRAKTRRRSSSSSFPRKTIGSNNSLTETNFRF